jgi:hypothetical protein
MFPWKRRENDNHKPYPSRSVKLLLALAREQKSYKTTKMQMFEILDKAKPGIESTRGLNLAAVRRTTVQMTRLPL